MNYWDSNNRIPFEQFRSEVCHLLKRKGDADFVALIMKQNWVKMFWDWNWYEESLYTLALLDYLSDLYRVTPFAGYDWYRKQSLDKPLLPQSVLIMAKLKPDDHIIEKTINDCQKNYCSSFFIKYNIVEGDIRDVA